MTQYNSSGFVRATLLCLSLCISLGQLYSADKECSLDILAYTFANNKVTNLQGDTIYRGKVDDFLITFRPSYGHAPPVTFSKKDGTPYKIDCGQYSYLLTSPGFRLSEGYIALFPTRTTTLVVLLTVGSIVEERTHAKVTFHVPTGESFSDGTIEAWFTAVDGTGTFGTSRSDGDSPSIEVRRGLYTVTVFHRQHALIVETVYLPPHDISVSIDIEKRAITFDDHK